MFEIVLMNNGTFIVCNVVRYFADMSYIINWVHLFQRATLEVEVSVWT
jgi:hypothetical protein